MGNPKGVKRDFIKLEQRRLKAARLFDRGLSQSAVSRKLGVHRQSVGRWHRGWKKSGKQALKHPGRAGRKPRLQPAQLKKLGRGLRQGPEALGHGIGRWTTGWVGELIERQTGQRFHPGHVWRIMRSMGWSCERGLGWVMQCDEPASHRRKRAEQE